MLTTQGAIHLTGLHLVQTMHFSVQCNDVLVAYHRVVISTNLRAIHCTKPRLLLPGPLLRIKARISKCTTQL